MKKLGIMLASAALAGLATVAPAKADNCDIQGNGRVDVITNFFPTLELLAKKMQECRRADLQVEVKMTTEHKVEVPRAFAASSSPFDAAAVANATISQINAQGLLRPLNDLVAKYKDKYKIEDQMLIRFGDDVMAVAFMANAQVFYYRKDLFEKHGIKIPTTYDEVLAAAEKLKGDPEISQPFGAAYGNTWELGNEFVDIFTAMGGTLTDPATSEAAFNSDAGVKTLELMKKLYGYMSPNALAMDFGAVKQQLQQGQIAMGFLWGDVAATMDDPSQSKVVDKIGFAVAPSAVAGGPPATLFWWDGYVIPKNSDGDADVTFQVLMEAIKTETVTANNDTTLWLRSAYKPTKYAQPIVDSVQKKAPPFPMTPQASLALMALGENIGDHIAGKESAEQSLDDAAKAYRRAATDAGYLK
ncbi:ABC transporter substrate-binding protein [Rhizobium sp. BK176]|uniref:ABC transporter substrate-binding protein n=1 Tax=Rhizobium sp. BK176 TaxID=2587071 RepID=UPI0021687CBC|nr:extracellular solute-binding protein [Rhizobium sp. BK176]MCS4096203.1 ABC-type glycerol-3-phosphate transport system substrate-binding protein [Rhizobium sp. BK176]